MAKRKPSNNKQEGNQYDKIIKENILSLIPALLKRVLGFEDYQLEDLPVIKLQTTIEREPDFLKLLYDKQFPKGRILQIEFETGNETYMEMRMLEYCSIIYRKFKKPVEQHLIFMGSKPSTMKTKIEFLDLSYQYKCHNLCEISYKRFIDSDQPEEVLLSILADKDDVEPRAIIQLILKRLVQLKGDSIATRKFVKQLEIISKLRNLQELTTKTIDLMSISYDIKTDVRFKQGQEIGREEGREEGIEIGIEEGKIIQSIITIRSMLNQQLITESIALASFLHVSIEFVEQTKEELKKETKIIKALSVKGASVNSLAKKFKVSETFVRTLRKLSDKDNKNQ